MSKRKTRRVRAIRAMSTAEKARWNKAADAMLKQIDEAWAIADGFDTAVRDTVAEGLAHLLNAAYDCRAIALDFKDFESRNSFIDGSIAEWFRVRGFAEWFCLAAASGFRTSRPRVLVPRIVTVINHRRKSA
jgi:hypothetical protein